MHYIGSRSGFMVQVKMDGLAPISSLSGGKNWLHRIYPPPKNNAGDSLRNGE